MLSSRSHLPDPKNEVRALYAEPDFFPTVDGLYIHFEPVIDPTLNKLCLTLADLLNESADLARLGWGPAIASYASVFVQVDPEQITLSAAVNAIRPLLERARERVAGLEETEERLHEIPVVYGGEEGPDLVDVARELGMSPDAVIEKHSNVTYRVYCQGFSPGFSFLGTLPPELHVSRLAKPRTKVPAGSVGLAGAQTGIYPLDSPGGWRLIGRTTVSLYRPPMPGQEEVPLLLRPGDLVRFRPERRRLVLQTQSCGEHGVLCEERDSVRSGQAGESTSPGGHVAVHDAANDREQSATAEQGAAVLSPKPAAIEVIQPGLLTTVQDLGRLPWQSFGFTRAGAMDRGALIRANRLVGNPDHYPCLEFTVMGPRLRFFGRGRAVVTGADLGAIWRGVPLPPEQVFSFDDGDELSFGARRHGMRAYLAVAGGFDLPVIAGSVSTDLMAGIGGYCGRSLRAGDRLPINGATHKEVADDREKVLSSTTSPQPERTRASARQEVSVDVRWTESGRLEACDRTVEVRGADGTSETATVVRWLPGPEFPLLASAAQSVLFQSTTWTIAPDSNRMGIRLLGPKLSVREAGRMLSVPLARGVIQLPPAGNPIVLMSDCQTIGGYPRLGFVLPEDVDRLAQCMPGEKVVFAPVSLTEVWRL